MNALYGYGWDSTAVVEVEVTTVDELAGLSAPFPSQRGTVLLVRRLLHAGLTG